MSLHEPQPTFTLWVCDAGTSICSCFFKSLALPQKQTNKLAVDVKTFNEPFVHRNDCCYNLRENVLNDTIASMDLAIAIIFSSQMIVGILGNCSLLFHYLFHYHSEGRLRPTDLILKQLIIANSLSMISKGVPHTLNAFGLEYFFHNLGCRLILYVQRVGRGASISSICLLSVFQTIMISPMNSWWKDLKVKAPKYVGFSITLCWITHIMVNFIIPVYGLYASEKQSSKNITKKRDYGYCSISDPETITGPLFVVLIIFPEVSLSGLMIWASGSMIFILNKHKQRIQHIHSTVSPRSSAESRAIQSTLVLVSTFVSFYFLSSIFHVGIALIYNPTRWLVNTSALTSMCFPTFSPFLIMTRNSTVPRLCFPHIRNTKSPNLIKKSNKNLRLFPGQLDPPILTGVAKDKKEVSVVSAPKGCWLNLCTSNPVRTGESSQGEHLTQ
ncbi:vomeronasal type-1 receptor 4-like [Herpailurus yagouaroundi]|uniref:vomeronasal type-1 receptor 4-like n=1 Tax=Herpailurus yagouaroundi TaxID=1608482 RepID=UPI001AD66A8F|nr:vomeronasal type-1 receptor 4-like [Puma yagouaroundi]